MQYAAFQNEETVVSEAKKGGFIAMFGLFSVSVRRKLMIDSSLW